MSRRQVTNTIGRRRAGGKASSLEWLARHDARVPRTWVIAGPDEVADLPLDPVGLYAVRSSAAAEDTTETAAAGKYLTELDVAGADVAISVGHVLAAKEKDEEMAVIVQEMVTPVVSGVAFSRNPVTGLSDVIVESIEGRGDALLQDGADPRRWTFRNGEVTEQPDDGAGSELASQVAAETIRLAEDFGPADLEWVWDGTDLYIVQIRPITTIGDVPIYSRAIAKDVMPGMIKPLVWSVNVPMVNAAWVRLFTEAIGPNDLEPESLARSFAYRSYFDMRAIGDIFELMGMPRDSLENLLGLPGAKGRMRPGAATFLKLPRMLGLALRLLRARSWVEPRREALEAWYRALDVDDLSGLSDRELVDQIDRLTELGRETAYLNIVTPLLSSAHTARFKKALAAAGLDFEEIGVADGLLVDPSAAIRELSLALEGLSEEDRMRAKTGDLEALDAASAGALDRVIGAFGYLSESDNDLSVPRWKDDPTIPVKLALATSSGTVPIQRAAWEAPTRKLARRRKVAIAHETMREAVGAAWTHGYGLLRPRFLEVGRRLAANGSLGAAEDIFYVTHDEAVIALTGSRPLQAGVKDAKAEMESVAGLVMPEMIVGDEWIPESTEVAEVLNGVGASRGRYRGTARFIERLSESDALADGEVLLVEYSDVAWTPLFSKAGAVVTAAGGMLAHSSIVAREMGIPCVASVANARALDGATVLVDGFTGEVQVESWPADSPATATA